MNFCFTSQSSAQRAKLMWICVGLTAWVLGRYVQGFISEKYAVSGLKLKCIWLVRFDAIKHSEGRLNLQITTTRWLEFVGGLSFAYHLLSALKIVLDLVLQCQNKLFKMLLMQFHLFASASCGS